MIMVIRRAWSVVLTADSHGARVKAPHLLVEVANALLVNYVKGFLVLHLRDSLFLDILGPESVNCGRVYHIVLNV